MVVKDLGDEDGVDHWARPVDPIRLRGHWTWRQLISRNASNRPMSLNNPFHMTLMLAILMTHALGARVED